MLPLRDLILEIDMYKRRVDIKILCKAREKIGVSEIRLQIILGRYLTTHYKQTERRGDEDHQSKHRESVEKLRTIF